MGGGDLNLKKSWHPSTMKNMERVWKAEQQDHEEKKRIAELKREITMERDREEMKAYAMEQGVIEKKEDKKLDWMYKGPHETVNRDEYLMGRRIDKQFEQMVQAEKEAEQNKTSSTQNHVEHECIPPSLRSFSGTEQVDLARKLQEDPLYAIKKKEMETRAELLKNPVKLKQLQQLVAQQKSQSSKSKNKKKKRMSSSDSDDNDKLDKLLAAKYKKLKDKLNKDELINSVKKHKKSKKAKKSKRRDSTDSDDSDKSDDRKRKSKYDSRSYGLMKADGTKLETSRKKSREDIKPEIKEVRKETKWIPPKKQKLSEEEKEKRRQEMLANASWRDKERVKSLKKYDEEEKKEVISKTKYDKQFIQKHLARAAEQQTIESRIKSNLNNIQRSNYSMDKNFAKR